MNKISDGKNNYPNRSLKPTQLPASLLYWSSYAGLDIDMVETIEEVSEETNELKNKEATGINNISAELLVHRGKVVISKLEHLCNFCWLAKSVPVD